MSETPTPARTECEAKHICPICGKEWVYTGPGAGNKSHHARIVDLQLAIVDKDALLAERDRTIEQLKGERNEARTSGTYFVELEAKIRLAEAELKAADSAALSYTSSERLRWSEILGDLRAEARRVLSESR